MSKSVANDQPNYDLISKLDNCSLYFWIEVELKIICMEVEVFKMNLSFSNDWQTLKIKDKGWKFIEHSHILYIIKSRAYRF